jgi:hypothetical protein
LNEQDEEAKVRDKFPTDGREEYQRWFVAIARFSRLDTGRGARHENRFIEEG